MLGGRPYLSASEASPGAIQDTKACWNDMEFLVRVHSFCDGVVAIEERETRQTDRHQGICALEIEAQASFTANF